MNMIKLRATQDVWYNTRVRKQGEEFDAPESEGKLLVGIGKAEQVQQAKKQEAVAAPKQLETRALKAEEPNADNEKPAPEVISTDSAPELTSTRKRRYMRRDMQAKE